RNASAHVLSGYEEIATVDPQETLAAQPEAAPVIRQTGEVRAQEAQHRQAPESITEPSPIRNASAHVLSGYEEIATVDPQETLAAQPEAAPVIRQTGEVRAQEAQHRQASENITEPSPIRNASAHVLSGYEEIATVEHQETLAAQPEAAPVIRQTDLINSRQSDGQSTAEVSKEQFDKSARMSESRQGSRETALFSSTAVQDQSHRVSFAAEDRNDLKMNAVLQEQTGQKQENAMSGDQETSFTDKQQAQVRHDAKNFAEKNAPVGTEFSAVMGKMKMENKAKVLPGDKNPEMNLSGSTITAGGSSRAVGTEMNPSQIINRVASEFRENLSNEGGRIKIILAPPSLGTLEMDVAVYHSKVRVLLTAENQDVQKMLSGNIDALKGALQNQGLNIDRCDVLTQDRKEQFAQNSGQEAFQRESDRRGQNESNEYRRGDTTEVLARKVTLLQSEARRSGKISLFA
ncbi:MAG TPA: flagellar hook-length control protein FliK, partial [Smithellaceae bacterium]|nr:flagellar hook-length control protein FliK [Smithellaceae bacterium]